MKNIYFIILTTLILMSSVKMHGQSDKFNTAILEIIKGFHSKDSDKINEYIHPDYGLIVLLRRGAMDEFKKTDKINFNKPIPEYLPYFPFKIDLKIQFQELPTFDCDSGKWNKVGLYCDTTRIDNLLSTTAINLTKYREENIPFETISKFKTIENKSRRIVLIDDEEGELVFYITLINNKWYLTILDRISSDCSA
ncbi:hypothetical protein [Plebeiibacterium sediminum]|uniref:Uncharacterized protein n=1 Tax=Plebeiibacterium sediminum TaxID=2992112 RepID=A0AAE3SIR6_9BACT|nr:hypothetical protein [Plebeiobacterium sediminum]MCW3789528.1 hypothetical protein [Plebeiobacterium sediminum]